MVSHQNEWLKPAVIKKMQQKITVLIWLIFLLIFYINHNWIFSLLYQLI